jgi:c-di-GMP-binding flagellar brake protein YcgR
MRNNDEARRKFPRTSHTYTISFKRHDEPDANWDISNSRNLSLGGALFLSSRPFSPETLLDIRLKIPTDNRQCCCKAKVVRCEGPFNNTFYKIAVCFTEIDPDYAEKIGMSVGFFLTKNKKV